MDNYLGQRLSFNGDLCTVRYIGPVAGVSGDWLGVEWDDPRRGKHNGIHQGRRHFECRSNDLTAASFLRSSRKADNPQGFLEALRQKYAVGRTSRDNPDGADIYFNGKLAEEVGFDKVHKRFATVYDLKTVALEGLRVKGLGSSPAKECTDTDDFKLFTQEIGRTSPNIMRLGLSRNMIESVDDIFALCSVMPQLEALDLSHNRFNVSTEERICDFDCGQGFRSVKDLDLSFTLMTCVELEKVMHAFPSLTVLRFLGNETERITNVLPSTVHTLDLSLNKINSLSDLRLLAGMPALLNLSLRSCPLRILETSVSVRFESVQTLDVTDSKLSFEELGTVGQVFPKLRSFRCSRLEENAALLLIARIGTLRELNSSKINLQMRVNAELFYLNKIEVELTLPEASIDAIKRHHPRWDELCSTHGRPDVSQKKQSSLQLISSSLHSTLVDIYCYDCRQSRLSKPLADCYSFPLRIPRTFSTHRLYMYVAEQLNTFPRWIRLVRTVQKQKKLEGLKNKTNDRRSEELVARKSVTHVLSASRRDFGHGNSNLHDDDDELSLTVLDDAGGGQTPRSELGIEIPPSSREIEFWIENTKSVRLKILGRGDGW